MWCWLAASRTNRAIEGRTDSIVEPTATADALTAGANNCSWAAAGNCQCRLVQLTASESASVATHGL